MHNSLYAKYSLAYCDLSYISYISFIDIFRQNKFLYKQALSNSFYPILLLVFQPYLGKQIEFKQMLDMTTQNIL